MGEAVRQGRWTAEIEGQEKPACFAESVVRLLA